MDGVGLQIARWQIQIVRVILVDSVVDGVSYVSYSKSRKVALSDRLGYIFFPSVTLQVAVSKTRSYKI